MPSSYVYLGGQLAFQAVVGADGEFVALFSDNNGLDWREIARVAETGEHQVDLKGLVYRRYDYRLRFVLQGAGTGLDSLKITHDIQHSQRPLPALAQGDNTIAFSAGPQEGTVTIEGSTNPANRGRQLFCTDFHPKRRGVAEQLFRIGETGKGDVTFPIATPGEMTRLRLSALYRARDARDFWDVQVSFDGGKSFRTVDRFAGPTVGSGGAVTVSEIPKGTRQALVRLHGEQRNTTCVFNLRLDADYREPNGGFRPVKVTYVWEEGGTEKRDAHVAAKPQETYRIRCDAAPKMRSLLLELAE